MLLTALACVACAALIAYFAPSLMTVGRWQLLHPRRALAAWFGAFFLGVALCAAALVLSVGGAVSASVSTPVLDAILLTLGGWLSLALFGALAFFVVSSAAPVVALERMSNATLASVATSREEFAGYTLVRFESSDEIAYAIPGKRPAIFLSSAMERALTPPQLLAVVAHEYAHLRQHHGFAMLVAKINAACLPGMNQGKSLKRATTLLVELAADDAAARQVGAVFLANALVTLSRNSGDQSMRLRAERLAGKQWPRRRGIVRHDPERKLLAR
ncbi:M56 family metallopeptidase [Arthrobacter sp. G.S.26]|uniref:M56 family metallopeptidase n=1 Tax=Micrococcaceae TaxID=1268 RepID=UPI002555E5B9|nr:M56 family metallopeptidase [Pseudarthrobacter sp. MEB009]